MLGMVFFSHGAQKMLGWFGGYGFKGLGMQTPKRIGKPEDVTDVVVFLASDKARWIIGASIPVDGGSKL